MQYEHADLQIGKYKEIKMQVAQNLSDCGYHEAIAEMYEAGDGPRRIADRFNNFAGKNIITPSGVSNALKKIGIKTKQQYASGRSSSVVKRVRFGNEPTGETRLCAKCERQFEKTTLNWLLCPSCFHGAPKEVPEFGSEGRSF